MPPVFLSCLQTFFLPSGTGPERRDIIEKKKKLQITLSYGKTIVAYADTN
jgi:hypothetical protein